jgi:membrane-associated phospholipid phosphatase
MRIDQDADFSRAVTRFTEQLLARFRTFWTQAPERFGHEALLGHFRVALVERRLHAERGKKWPRWLGPTTRVGAQIVMIRAARRFLKALTLQLTLFGALAGYVHLHPIVPLDIAITRRFQQNQAPWLRITMLAISFPGSSPLLPILVVGTTSVCWVVGLRLEAVFVGGLSTVSLLLSLLIKVLVGRPRPTGNLVHVMKKALGYSFPSGHVMAYIAYFGLLFAFGVILLRGRHWWRTALLMISAALVVLIGPSRVYLGDHWASDVLGGYLIGESLLGIAVAGYLPLKLRGMLETPGARARRKRKKVLWPFLTKVRLKCRQRQPVLREGKPHSR